jgi:hypothetical protein
MGDLGGYEPEPDRLSSPLTTHSRHNYAQNIERLQSEVRKLSGVIRVFEGAKQAEADRASELESEIETFRGRLEHLLEEIRILNEEKQVSDERVQFLEEKNEEHHGYFQEALKEWMAIYDTTEAEARHAKAGEAAALEKMKNLEIKLDLRNGNFESAKYQSREEASFDFTPTTRGTQEKQGPSSLASTSKDRNSNQSSEKQASRKKSKSKENGVLSRIFGTKEPSLDALNELRKKTFAEANVDENDPDAAAKLGVSSKKLPPEAPKPASKDPIPKVPGHMSKLRRFSGFGNIQHKDTKNPRSTESRKDTSPQGQSLTSETKESMKGSKSSEYGARPSSHTS